MNFGIIAAGEGSRLVEEGVAYPKPLVPICGTPMIERLINIFMENGADHIAIIVNEQMTEVRKYVENLASELSDRVNISLTVKTTPSSMHSFYELGSRLAEHGRFILTTVDTIFSEKDFGNYVKAYARTASDVDGMMAVTRYIDDEKPLYVDIDSSGDIKGFLDEPREGVKTISAGIYGLGPEAVEVLDKCVAAGVSRMRNFQRALVSEGLCLKSFEMGKVIDVDHAGDIRKAEELIKGWS